MLKKRTLGSTGIHVSPLGLGTVKFGRNQGVKYPTAFDIPSLEDITSLLHLAHDLGLNVIDTAPAYGMSEERLGQLLKGQRKDWVIVSKAGEIFDQGQSHYNFTPEFLIRSVEQSLKRLKTDYLDVCLIHSDGNDQSIIQQGALECLSHLKQQGKILASGMSTKTIEGGLLCVAQADVVMVTYHPEYQDEIKVLEAAEQANKGVLIKKALSSGHLYPGPQDPVFRSLSFIFKQPSVSSVVIGTINPSHLQHNVQMMRLVDESNE
jgi:aryl-alcohol dehydrogenase-like predicted oxidoreductase